MVFLQGMFKPSDILTIAQQCQQDAVGILPFDTLIGLTGVVSEPVISRIQTIKQRQDQPFILILSDWNMLQDWVAPLSFSQEMVLRHYWPGPITFLFKKHPRVPEYVTCSKPTIAIRMIEYLPINFLLKNLNQPIVSTSVNLTGEAPAMCLEDCSKSILSQVDFMLDLCRPLYHQPSTIVDLSGAEPRCLRQGVIPYEAS
jgi:L-threonylcarbamoyladenylate synthase